jgi:hypothetical protein
LNTKNELEHKAIYISTQKLLHEKRLNELKGKYNFDIKGIFVLNLITYFSSKKNVVSFFKRHDIKTAKDITSNYLHTVHVPTIKDFEGVINREIPHRIQNKYKLNIVWSTRNILTYL